MPSRIGPTRCAIGRRAWEPGQKPDQRSFERTSHRGNQGEVRGRATRSSEKNHSEFRNKPSKEKKSRRKRWFSRKKVKKQRIPFDERRKERNSKMETRNSRCPWTVLRQDAAVEILRFSCLPQAGSG